MRAAQGLPFDVDEKPKGVNELTDFGRGHVRPGKIKCAMGDA
jgi:hypothetical protein